MSLLDIKKVSGLELLSPAMVTCIKLIDCSDTSCSGDTLLSGALVANEAGDINMYSFTIGKHYGESYWDVFVPTMLHWKPLFTFLWTSQFRNMIVKSALFK